MAQSQSNVDPFLGVIATPAIAQSAGLDADPFTGIVTPHAKEFVPQAPAQDYGPWRIPAIIGQQAAIGATGLYSLPGQIEQMARPLVAPNTNPIMPTEGPIGVTPGLTPRSGLESYVAAGARGLGAALPFVLGGGALEAGQAARAGNPLIPALGRGMATTASAESIGAGVGGAEAGQAAHDAGLPGWAQAIAGVVPAFLTGGISGGLQLGVQGAKLKQLAGVAEQSTQAAIDAQAALAKSKLDVQIGQGDAANALSAPVAGLDAAKAAVAKAKVDSAATRDQLTDLAERSVKANTDAADASVAQIAQAHGNSSTWQDAGTAQQQYARKWLSDTLPNKLSAAWEPVNEAIEPTTPTPLGAFTKALEDVNSSAGVLEPLAKVLKPGLPARLQSAMDSAELGPDGIPAQEAKIEPTGLLGPNGQPLTKVTQEAQPPQPITWADVQKLRSTLGDAMANPMTVKDIGAQNLSRLYASVTQDMRNAALGVGDEAVDAFDNANAESSRLYGIAQGPVAKIVSGPKADLVNDPQAGAVAQTMLGWAKSGDSWLKPLSDEGFPVKELTAAQLRQAGGDAAMSGLTPEAKAVLMPDANSRSAIDLTTAIHASGPDTVKAATAYANATHDAEIARVQLAQAQAQQGVNTLTGQYDRTNSQLDANRLSAQGDYNEAQTAKANALLALRKAQAAMRPAPGGAISHAIQAGVGEQVGQVLSPALGPLAAPLGALAPSAARSLLWAAGRPGQLRNTVIGAEAGQSGQVNNPLRP